MDMGHGPHGWGNLASKAVASHLEYLDACGGHTVSWHGV